MEENTKVIIEETNVDDEFFEEKTDVTATENEEQNEEKHDGKFSKFVSGVKKHGKKIAVGTVVTIGGLVGYAILKAVKSGNDVEIEDYDSTDDVIDVKFSENE